MKGQYMKKQKRYPGYETGVKGREQTTKDGKRWSQG